MINSIFPFMIVMVGAQMALSNTGKNHTNKKSEQPTNWQLQYSIRQSHGY
jgi:hypothetical protein